MNDFSFRNSRGRRVHKQRPHSNSNSGYNNSNNKSEKDGGYRYRGKGASIYTYKLNALNIALDNISGHNSVRCLGWTKQHPHWLLLLLEVLSLSEVFAELELIESLLLEGGIDSLFGRGRKGILSSTTTLLHAPNANNFTMYLPGYKQKEQGNKNSLPYDNNQQERRTMDSIG